MNSRVACYQESSYEQIQIEAYLPLVNKIVNQLNIKESTIVDRDDLLSIGVMGLLDAAKKYKADKFASFETYARLRIKGAILDELRKLGVLSRDNMSEVKRYYQKKEELSQQLLMQPTDEQLCEYMNISSLALSKIYLNLHYLSTASLDETINDRDGQKTLMDLLQDQTDSILVKLERRNDVEALAQAIECLDQREQYILQFYYVEELSLAQMSEILNLSVSRISQLHGKAISNLRQHLKSMKG